MNLILRATLFGLCAATAGCISGANTVRLYPGDMPLAEVGVVYWDGSVTPLLLKVDGIPVPQGRLKINRVEMRPGAHVFTVRPTAGPDEHDLMFRIEAGRCYQPIQRLISTERAPEIGDEYVWEHYEPPTFAESHDQPCVMRDD